MLINISGAPFTKVMVLPLTVATVAMNFLSVENGIWLTTAHSERNVL